MKFSLKAVGTSILIGLSSAGHAGIPVVDGGNLYQNTVTAIQAVAAVKKQIEQYDKQLDQYADQLQNTKLPSDWHWDQASQTMDKLIQTVDTINYYKNQSGSIEKYLEQYQDLGHYRTSPCFTAAGCTKADREKLAEQRRLAFEARKKANDAAIKSIDLQQQKLDEDADRLEDLQASAQSAEGRMQAIQYANQFASEQAAQLMQIRGLLLTQQNAMVSLQQADNDRKAQEQAASESFRASGEKTESTPMLWSVQ